MSLKTDYKDAIPASGTLRKYKQIDNGDGTYSFQDVTTYSQVGDKAQASVFNTTNAEVNSHEARVDNPHSVTAAQVGLGNVNNTSDASKTVNAANYPSHAVGLADFGLRGNYISSASPSGGNDGDSWDQV